MPCASFAMFPLRFLQMRFLLVSLVLAGLLVPIAARAQVLFLAVKTTVGSGFNTPYGTAVDRNGNVFVADYSNQAVYEIVASDGVVSSTSTVVPLASPSGGYSQPVGVAVDKYGDVFVADAGTANAVDEIVAVNGVVNGSSVVNKLAGLPVFGYPNDLAVDVDGSGDVFIVYPQNQVVFEIVASGGAISSSSPIIPLPAPSGGWAQPSGLAVDGSGNVFVADSGRNALYEILAAGGYTTVNTIDASTAGATTVAADGNGNVFFIGSYGTVLYEIPASGGYTTVDIVAVGFSGNYFGIAADGHGNIFVADAANSVVDEVALDRVNFGSQAIGSPSETIAMPFNIGLAGPTTLGRIAILTTGVAGRDFADAGSSTCIAATYSYSTNCVVNVSFTPLTSGLRRGAVVFYDGSGNVLATVPIYGVGTGPQVAFLPGTRNTLASGSFSSPSGVAVDVSGNLFVADSGNSVVKEILAAGGYAIVNTLGSGFSQPAGVAVDGSGNLFVADSGNHVVKEILAAGGYTTVNTLGSSFSQPAGVALDGGGDVLVADAGNNAVYEILASGGYTTVNTLGSGFNNPNGVAVDGNGNVFVADSGNSAVKEILAVGNYTTINTLGSGFARPVGVAVGGSGSVYVADATNNAVYAIPASGGYTSVNTLGSGFKAPSDVAVDGSGNVFVADRGNFAVKKLDFADPPSLTFASAAVGATSIDSPKTVEIQNIGNQALTLTGLSYPTDFPEGGSDASACTGSTILSPAQECDLPVDFTPLSAGSLSESVTLTGNALNVTGAQQSISVSGTGQITPSITWTTPAAIAYGNPLSGTQLNATASVAGAFAYNPPAGAVLTAGSQPLSVTFTPNNTTNYTTATAHVTLQVNKATTNITFSANPTKPTQGQSDLLTATVTGAGQPSGTVVFSSGATTLCTATLNPSGIGSCSFVPSTNGNLTVTPQYQGDANHLTSSATLTLSVNGAAVKLQLSSTQLVYPGSTNLTACITPTTATGTVQIYDGTTLLTTQSVQGGGCAYWYISPGLSAGTHLLTAVYSGDKNNPSGTSVPVTVTVSPVPVTLSAACWNASFAYGANYQCTVNLSSNAGAAQGSITYSLDGGSKVAVPLSNGNAQFTLTTPSVGTHTVIISFAQQTNYAAAPSQTETFTATPAPVIVSLTPSSWYTTVGTSLTFQAAVSSWSAGAPNATGAVSFYDGTKLLSTKPVNTSGQASYTIATLTAGTHTITATYSGGTNYASGSSSVIITLIQ
jgi:sugar lactone lactonase YvrE